MTVGLGVGMPAAEALYETAPLSGKHLATYAKQEIQRRIPEARFTKYQDTITVHGPKYVLYTIRYANDHFQIYVGDVIGQRAAPWMAMLKDGPTEWVLHGTMGEGPLTGGKPQAQRLMDRYLDDTIKKKKSTRRSPSTRRRSASPKRR